MSDQLTNAIVAIVLGSAVAVVLLLPTAAYQYRLDGRLQARDLAVLLSGAVYGLALWTYTLLPMPVPGSYRCQGRQLDPLGSIRPIWEGLDGVPVGDGLVGLLRQPAFLQVALNVLLFVPLGFFLRVILRRGVVTALVVGLGTSLLIETTQTTGVWSLYECPYRLFDVDDLVVNTLGAVGGSLLSWVFLDRRDDTTAPLPTTISLGRRLVGMLGDALFVALLGGTLAAAYRGWELYGPGSGRVDADLQTALLLGVPYLVEAVSVLASGRTIGEHVVAVRTVARRPGTTFPARMVKLGTGVTPFFALVTISATSPRVGLVGLAVLGVLHVLVAWRTEQRRGLSSVLAGLDLRIAAEEAFEREEA